MAWSEATSNALECGWLDGLEVEDANVVDPKGRRNYLHIAAGEGQVESVRWLLSRGATPDGTTNLWTPLHSAAEMGHAEICEVLIDAGADVRAAEFGAAGGTPLVLALFYGQTETCSSTRRRTAGRSI